MFQTIKEQHGGVDVCINNAGMSLVASILEGKTSDWRYMFEVHVCICVRCVLPFNKYVYYTCTYHVGVITNPCLEVSSVD